MKCKLCLSEKTLRDSHCIPKNLYRYVCDEKRRSISVIGETSRPELEQDFPKEKLLCESCEQKLGKWDNFLHRVMAKLVRGNVASPSIRVNQLEEKIFLVEGVQYEDFKLAILSILWRMSVASAPSWQSYSLGSYEEDLRDRIYRQDAGKEEDYPVWVARYELDGNFEPGAFSLFSPRKYGRQRISVQQVMLCGHLFQIFMGKGIHLESDLFFLKKAGNFLMDVRSLKDFVVPHSPVLRLLNDDSVTSLYDRLTSSN